MILSIDPATHGVGAALWYDARTTFRPVEHGTLHAAAYVPNKSTDFENYINCAVECASSVSDWVFRTGLLVDVVVFEMPQVYQRGKNKTLGDPNKCVLPLVAVDAAIAAMFPKAVCYAYQPHSWKGGTNKPERVSDGEYTIKQRVKERLTAEELKNVDWSNNVKHSWDVADALGVGLYYLGRFERKRVLARN